MAEQIEISAETTETPPMCIFAVTAAESRIDVNHQSELAVEVSPNLVPSADWTRYFLHNRANLMEIPWEEGAGVPPAVMRRLAPSIQEFQLGESSEGNSFLQRAREWAQRSGDGDYIEALTLFIQEEQRHGCDLGRYLKLAGVACLDRTAVDHVFRRLRKLAGLELSIVVLVTAELVATVYYDALRSASDCRVLSKLCDQILQDEEKHVQFQAERLAILRRGRGRLYIAGWIGFHVALTLVTCVVIWPKHGPVFRAGKIGLFAMSRQVLGHLRHCLKRADPKSYGA